MMCSVCREGKPLSEDSIAEYTIEDNLLKIHYMAHSCDSSFEESIKINFCPMCGTSLNY